MEWKDIERVNQEINPTEIPAKKKDERGNWIVVANKYVEVKERVIAFRKLYPTGKIETKVDFQDNYVFCEAVAKDGESNFLANAHAREQLNKAFALENCETSAIGRCLGFLGLGISTSLATKEDMENLEKGSGIFDEPTPTNINLLVRQFTDLYSLEEQIKIMNKYKVTDAVDIGASALEKYVADRKEK